jgi:hypothetical protein
LLATPTPQAVPVLPPGITPADLTTPTRESSGVSRIASGWKSRRPLVWGSALVLLLALVGLASRSSHRSEASQKESSTAIPSVAPPSLSEVKGLTEVPIPSVMRPEIAVRPPEPAARIRHTRNAKARKPAKDCDPPFFIDAKGIRRIKAHCL